MIDQAFAAPADRAESFATGMGSQVQRSAPERASNARTTPLGMSVRPLSLIDDPTTTRSSMTAGGEVMWYEPGL